MRAEATRACAQRPRRCACVTQCHRDVCGCVCVSPALRLLKPTAVDAVKEPLPSTPPRVSQALHSGWAARHQASACCPGCCRSGMFQDNVYCHITSGLGAGLFAVICGSPVDVVKSRMMGAPADLLSILQETALLPVGNGLCRRCTVHGCCQ